MVSQGANVERKVLKFAEDGRRNGGGELNREHYQKPSETRDMVDGLYLYIWKGFSLSTLSFKQLSLICTILLIKHDKYKVLNARSL